jgi:hypothetical protein
MELATERPIFNTLQELVIHTAKFSMERNPQVREEIYFINSVLY